MKLTSFVSSLIACAVLTFPFTHATAKGSDLQKLSEVLAAQSDETKTRYEYRHPQETIEFFGIKPGMTVVEALPGGGWYSQILVPYLGEKGRLVGVDYSSELWPHFEWMNEKFLQGRKDWLESFPENAKEWGKGQGAKTEAYTFATLPKKLTKQADAVLFIRALHNLNRFEPKGQFMTQALNESYRMLKKGECLVSCSMRPVTRMRMVQLVIWKSRRLLTLSRMLALISLPSQILTRMQKTRPMVLCGVCLQRTAV